MNFSLEANSGNDSGNGLIYFFTMLSFSYSFGGISESIIRVSPSLIPISPNVVAISNFVSLKDTPK